MEEFDEDEDESELEDSDESDVFKDFCLLDEIGLLVATSARDQIFGLVLPFLLDPVDCCCCCTVDGLLGGVNSFFSLLCD